MKKILFLEPDKEQIETFGSWLKEEGYEVDSADNLKQASHFLSGKNYDILIMDIDARKNVKSMLNLCRTIKEGRYISELPITVITYHKNIKIIANLIEAGVDSFILKPFETQSFIMRLDTIFTQIELKSLGKKVIDLSYINYLINLTSKTNRENILLLFEVIINELILKKVNDILGKQIITILIKRLDELVGRDYEFIKEVRFSDGKILLKNVDKTTKEVPAEKLITAFRDYIYGFVQLIQVLTSDILMDQPGY